ncbi:MAG TPA: nucleotidyltransferase domain-containing protein [Propionibacteriaceae bacterium]|nr:nucleotidyltransferase domain-containing protein [Propionibacteriaceae bacterium]
MTGNLEHVFFGEPFGGVIPGARGAVLAALLRTDAPLTGRQIHATVSDDYSLWTVQEALKVLTQLGLVNTQQIGRAGVHTINEDHVAVAPLRALLDPIAALTDTVREAAGDDVKAVILFGSIARGEAKWHSDVDLAVIAPASWDGRTDLEDVVSTRLGNNCDVLVFTSEDFARLSSKGEPVVREILTTGVALIGSIPRVKSGVA